MGNSLSFFCGVGVSIVLNLISGDWNNELARDCFVSFFFSLIFLLSFLSLSASLSLPFSVQKILCIWLAWAFIQGWGKKATG